MAQMGSFVPARSARLGIVDRIFTRIGASDNLARGRSTFMVEMTETAAILHTATPRSLILLDEIGRGTATYDGLAIAWAAVEYLHARVQAKTFFATHYFELTELADCSRGKELSCVGERDGRRHCLSAQSRTGRSRSQLWHRGRQAGWIAQRSGRARARSSGSSTKAPSSSHRSSCRPARIAPPAQLTIFTPLSQPVLEKLREVDLNRLTPLEALNLLAELKKANLTAHPRGNRANSGAAPRTTADHRLRWDGDVHDLRPCSSESSRQASFCSHATFRAPTDLSPTERLPEALPTPLFTCVDLEGGVVDRFRTCLVPRRLRQSLRDGDRRLYRKHGESSAKTAEPGLQRRLRSRARPGFRSFAQRHGFSRRVDGSARQLLTRAHFSQACTRLACSVAANTSPGWAKASSTAIMSYLSFKRR